MGFCARRRSHCTQNRTIFYLICITNRQIKQIISHLMRAHDALQMTQLDGREINAFSNDTKFQFCLSCRHKCLIICFSSYWCCFGSAQIVHTRKQHNQITVLHDYPFYALCFGTTFVYTIDELQTPVAKKGKATKTITATKWWLAEDKKWREKRGKIKRKTKLFSCY